MRTDIPRRITTVFPHLLAFLLLFLSWKHMDLWYLYRAPVEFFLCFVLLTAGLIAASARFLYLRRDRLPVARVLWILPLLFVILPWGELFRLNFPNTREEWSRQIFFNCIFIYGCFLVFSLLPSLPAALHRATRSLLDAFSPGRMVMAIPALLLFVFCSAICLLVYRQTPAVNDGAAYLFQAKIFAAGKLYASAPAHPEFFDYRFDMLAMKDGKWFSMYPPGFPLLLALSMFLKAEWFLDPFLGACTLAIWIEYARRWHGRQTAMLFGILGLFSPFIFQMFSTVIVHAPELCLASAAIYLCRRETESPSFGRGLCLALILMLGVLVRGFSLLVFLTPVLLYTGWNALKRRSFAGLMAGVAGIAAGVLMTSWYQWQTTGDPFLPPYLVEYPGLKYGFGENFLGLVHSPARALEQLSNSLLGLNQWLNGWHSGSLFLVIAFFVAGPALQKWDRLLLLCCLCLAGFYFFYIAQDLIFGPRFIFLCAPFLLLCIARCAGLTEGDRTPASVFLYGLMVVGFLSFLPLRLHSFIGIYDPANDPPEYLKIRIREIQPEKKIVFLDQQIHQDYINWNDPFLRGTILFCRDLGSRNATILNAHPNHTPVYFRPKPPTISGHDPTEIYGFYSERDTLDHSQISFFELAAALQSAGDGNYQDFFDVTYPVLFYTFAAAPRLQFLQQQASALESQTGYRASFNLALIHTARMLLLPRLAYEKGGFKDWNQFMDFAAFRIHLDEAQQYFRRSGEAGAGMVRNLEVIRKRIDLNRDGVLSETECSRYLSEKILLLAEFV